MSNFKHYIKQISTGNSFFTLKMKMNYMSYALAIFQCILAAMFWLCGLIILATLEICLALYFFIVVPNIVKKEKYAQAMISSMFVVAIISFTATACIGFDSGFANYLFGCVAASFYLSFVIESIQKKGLVSIGLSLAFLICYLINYGMMQFIDPIFQLPSGLWKQTFFLLSTMASFAIIIAFNVLFIWEINSRNSLLSNQNLQLNELAHKDPLTKLLNRRCMDEHLNLAVETLKITGKRFCLILCDIDNFKHVNDTYGHDAGDAVLVSVSSIISSTVRDSDVVCRWGGEEILILISDSKDAAIRCAERIRNKLMNHITKNGDDEINVTMTFGISESIPGYRIEQLIQIADERLYFGKKNGKNQVVSQ